MVNKTMPLFIQNVITSLKLFTTSIYNSDHDPTYLTSLSSIQESTFRHYPYSVVLLFSGHQTSHKVSGLRLTTS